jgi:hypothetical protein
MGDQQEKPDKEFGALRQRTAEANLEERARKLAHHLLTTARKSTPLEGSVDDT